MCQSGWVAVPLWVNASAFAGAGDLSGDGNMDMVLRHTDGALDERVLG